ncbi:MAG: bifunctional riboflavin kinase/FMN adenylyltransferase [Elusimicrobiota bacterium]|jgi:riboflavin kinase/FMN adenylyltransferase|nr:bifunctional riboflavin kinase/FMN adenylyltransferase [Elusimicrobiota bacterium]
MKVFFGINRFHKIKIPQKTIVIAIGFFDGLHLGHQKVIEEAKNLAKKINGYLFVLTFARHPKMIIKNETYETFKLLLTNREKIILLKKINVNGVVFFNFNKTFSEINPKIFFSLISKKFKLKCLVVGKDFCFGADRKGNIDLLNVLTKKVNIELKVVNTLYLKEDGYLKEFDHEILLDEEIFKFRKISSTFIKNELLLGNIEKVNLMLGYNFFIRNKVIKGLGLARKFGFPTANIFIPRNKILPEGVFVGRVNVDEKIYNAVLSSGKRESLDKNKFKAQSVLKLCLEAHILDFNENIYGKEIEVYFIKKIRDQIKFETIDLVFEQVKKDVEFVKDFNYKHF